MIDVNQLRRGVTFVHDGALLKVTEYSHTKPGRGKATIRVKVRDLRTGTNKEVTFSSGDRVEDVRLDKSLFQYLYDDGTFYVFMDQSTYEQKQVVHSVLESDAKYLRDNMEPVSYTHLDVYKRQIQRCMPKSIHAVTAAGFEMKVVLFVLGLSLHYVLG